MCSLCFNFNFVQQNDATDFTDITLSQGSVATRLRRGRIFDDRFTTNFQAIVGLWP